MDPDGTAVSEPLALSSLGVVWMGLFAIASLSRYLPYWVWRRGDELARLLLNSPLS